MKAILAALLLSSVLASPVVPRPASIPARFPSRGADRAAIERLLQTYTRAVSTKDEALFETLLLAKDIPFSDVRGAVGPGGGTAGTRHYEQFRQGVFAGPPFTQRFRNVRIEQDGSAWRVWEPSA